ncbi:AfsR family transcriptional regulator, partial [Streptomyces sp. SP18CS02]|nr:AfsR family transcriptional regulator [Streptomyces sp. SP18CS02]
AVVPGVMRYRLLETVAEYAAERLDEAGDRDGTEHRHLVHYRELARTGENGLRGPRQPHWLAVFESEHDNLRAALRTAVRSAQEQEALCLTLSMSWFWQLRGHLSDARTWSAAAAGLGPDPFLPPVRPAVPLRERSTRRPPPWSEEQLWEARRGARLMVLAGDGSQGAAAVEKPENRAYLEAVADAYRPGLPQNSRQPGAMWFFVRLMLGEFAGLAEALDACVGSAQAYGDDAELGFALLMRAKLVPGGADDADRALTRFEAAGDPWGIAEALCARGETHERAGRYAEALRDFGRAVDRAERIGARIQATVFRARLAGVRLRTAEGAAERERAEGMLLAAAEEAADFDVEVIGTARLLLVQHFGGTGRVALARRQLRLIEEEFTPGTAEMFTGIVLGLHGWLDCLDGEYARAHEHLEAALRRLESLAHLVAPLLVTGQFPAAAWVMARQGEPRTGALLLGAYDRNVPGTGGTGFRQLTPEAEAATRQRAEREVRAGLAPRDYARAHEEGGRLSVREAAALVRRPGGRVTPA